MQVSDRPLGGQSQCKMTFLGDLDHRFLGSPVYGRLTILAGAPASGANVAVAVMGGAQQAEIVRRGGAAAGIRHDVIDLQQVLGAATAPLVRST